MPEKTFVRMLFFAVGLIFSIGMLAVADADAWWDSKWQKRKQIQFDASAKSADTKDNLTDVPVLVRLHHGNFSFSDAKPDGADIRFVSADDKSPLKYHIEQFDPKKEIALIWVKVPRITAGSNQDSVWMYYGNPSAPDGQDAGGTYDVNQIAVWHMREKDGLPKDATSFNNHATAFTAKLGLAAVIGGGAQFEGGEGRMTVVKSPSMNFAKGFTFSAWVRLNQPAANAHILSWDDGGQSIIIGMNGMSPYSVFSTGRGQSVSTQAGAALTPQKWHLVAVTVEPDRQVTMYVDGFEVGSSKYKGSLPAPSGDMVIGNAVKGGSAFVGDIDEIQLSNIARPAGWFKVAFHGQGPDGAMTTYLKEESGSGGESLTIHLMKVIIRTITLDGWLIIGTCVLLGLWALWIFRQKMILLREGKKGNEAFAELFQQADHPLELQDTEGDYGESSLYQVYSTGCEELRLWFQKGESFSKGDGLSDRAINSFRAAVEKEAMYETRRLYAGMIIMNVCVAGGPFLGLLGTVWGVMNTFAGLAEAGEANLAAIAPGVASALACTMAGLLIAIPCLFASSYIVGEIKDMTADMNVFIDDFIRRLENERRDPA